MSAPLVDRGPTPSTPLQDLGVKITAPIAPPYEEILSLEALRFLARLSHRFEHRRQELLELRVERQRQLDDGALLDFLPETSAIRLADWRVAPTPPDLVDRRLEITGPVERQCHGSTLHRAGETAAAGMKPHLAGSPSTII